MRVVISLAAAIGSKRELPSESCNEVKKSEKGQDGKYWLLSVIPGTPVYADCNMKTGGCQGKKSIHHLFILMINLVPKALEKKRD